MADIPMKNNVKTLSSLTVDSAWSTTRVPGLRLAITSEDLSQRRRKDFFNDLLKENTGEIASSRT
jgi:hypothetical protein